jgi:glycosyltransferase involved in cell wall biosynthesis
LPEVGGDAALYFDPLNADSISKSFSMVLNNLELRQNLIEAGNRRLDKFSWENTYQKTLNFYNSIA